MVHPIVELEVADGELRVIDVMVERVQLGFVDPVVLGDLGIEAFQRLEVVLLVRVVERLSEVEILQLPARGGRSGGQESRHGDGRCSLAGSVRGHELPASELDAGIAGILRPWPA